MRTVPALDELKHRQARLVARAVGAPLAPLFLAYSGAISSIASRAIACCWAGVARTATAYAYTGVSLDVHLTALRRDAFTRAGARPIKELPQMKHGQAVKIGGLIVAVQRPQTAKGFCFLAVEDSDGLVNVVVAPKVYAECREAIHSAFVIIEGQVQHDYGAISVLARK